MPHCAFCPSPTEITCAWPHVQRVIPTDYRDVRHGDIWITEQQSKRGQVIEIEPSVADGLLFWVRIDGGKAVYPYPRGGRYDRSTCPILQLTPCNQPCCELHSRELADDHHICMDCWPRQLALVASEGPRKSLEREWLDFMHQQSAAATRLERGL